MAISAYNTIKNSYFSRKILAGWQRLEASPAGFRLIKGALWSFAGSVISRGLMMAAWIIVARILGKETYGEFGIIRSTVNMFTVFAGFGLGLTATKYIAEFRNIDPQRAGRIMGLSGLFAAVSGGLIAFGLVIFAPWLAQVSLNAPHLANPLRIGALMLFLTAINGAQTGALAGFEAFKAIAVVNSIAGVLAFPLFLAGAMWGGLNGAIWAYAINLCILWVLSHLALRKAASRNGVPFSYKRCFQEWPVLWQYSLPAVLSGIMVSPVKWICDAFLVNQEGGYGQMGVYSATIIFQTTLLFISSTISKPLLSMLANMQDGISDSLARMNIMISWCMGIVIALPLFCFPEIGQALFGKEYVGPQFRQAMALITLFTCVIMYKEGLARVLAAKSLMWWGVLSNGVWAIILIIGAYFLVPYGAPGLAASYALAYIGNTVVIMPLYIQRKLVPGNTLFSKETGMIWFVLAALTGVAFLNLPFWSRVLLLPLSCTVLGIAAFRILCSTGR